MSRLLVITRPELQTGFLLAGVAVYPAADVETAVEFIEDLLAAHNRSGGMGESYLLAIDAGLLEKMDAAFLRRLEAAEHLPFLAIPGGQKAEEVLFRRRRIAELTRRAVGFHSIFRTEKAEEKDK
jgi:vacuolar-type H+-ATPase subunit F/Vma7